MRDLLAEGLDLLVPNRRNALEKRLNEARLQVLSIVEDLGVIRFRLLGVKASLPPGIAELDRFLEAETADEMTEIRTTIDCVLKDCILPAEEVLGNRCMLQLMKHYEAERCEREEGEGEDERSARG